MLREIVALNNSTVNIYAGGIAGLSSNRNIGNCYSEIQTVVVQRDTGGTAIKFGGTLFGEISGNVTSYKNYFINDYAVGLGVGSITNFTIKYNLAENGIDGLVTLLNAGYTTVPFAKSGSNLVLMWEL